MNLLTREETAMAPRAVDASHTTASGLSGRSRRRAAKSAREDGFSLVELMVVVLVIASLVMIAIPVLFSARALARERTCLATRTTVEIADYLFYLDEGRWTVGLSELVGEFLKSAAVCPSGGTYAWIDAPTAELPARTLGCSVHFFPTASPSPLGYTFSEITSNMSALMNAYYTKNGRWPRSWSPYNYTDLGLDPANWSTPVDHVYYTPNGNRMSVRPEVGYVLTVKSTGGKTITLTAKSDWSIVQDLTSGKWYYHEIQKDNQVNIATLQTIQK